MAIDLTKETLIAAKDGPNHLPKRSGKKVSRYAMYRWMRYGVRGTKLEYIQFPSGKYTSVEAIHRFLDKLTVTNTPAQVVLPHADTKSSKRQSQIEKQIDDVRHSIRPKVGTRKDGE